MARRGRGTRTEGRTGILASVSLSAPKTLERDQVPKIELSDVCLALIAACVLYALIHGWG